MSPTETFYGSQTPQSAVKTRITVKYFRAWASVMLSPKLTWVEDIAYIDLYSGPGVYADGTASTPVQVLQIAIDDPALSDRLVTIFNDHDELVADELESKISTLPGIDALRHRPTVLHRSVEEGIINDISEVSKLPSLLFIDPWGYKGLTRELIGQALKNWGCDCIFFFNYARVNAAIENPFVEQHIEALFGQDRLAELRLAVHHVDPVTRERLVMDAMQQGLVEIGGTYALRFGFEDEDKDRTSHYLIFVSKSLKGYSIMKDIMGTESTEEDDGVPSFAFVKERPKQGLLFGRPDPIGELKSDLLTVFSGRTLTVQEMIDSHNVGTPFVPRNYQEALRQLEAAGSISVMPPATARPMRKGIRTLSTKCTVTIPPA